MVISGDVVCTGRLVIEGKLEGSFSGPDLLVKETGQMIGLVTGEAIECFGRIEGRAFAGSLSLRQTGCQVGTVEVQALDIEPGAVLDCVLQSGTLKMQDPDIKIAKSKQE